MNETQEISFKNLLEQFELTKKELGNAEESIRRLTGRKPENFGGEVQKGLPGLNKRRIQPLPVPDKPFAGRKRPLFPIVKDVPPEEEAEEEEEIPTKKPSLLSTVVASPKDIKSRKDTIQEQNVNSKVKARNRRMFGMILGTLQKFQHDAKKRQEKDLKRAEIEQKVEAAAAEERERIKREKEELFQTRREKQAQLRCLEKKLEIAEQFEAWERNEKRLVNFIITKTEPHIYFLPAVHNSKTMKCLENSRKKTLERIQERREKMEKELLQVEELYKKDNFPGDKENIGPLEEEDDAEEIIENATQPQAAAEESQASLAENQNNTENTIENHEGPLVAEETEITDDNKNDNETKISEHATDQDCELDYD